ncbi:hypothetical protein VTJ83DRAFT_1370 [Remersonia thermophila]|uniref:NAD(P)-binding protein n=1 Tax=Remersonia thermophila TaxID=72144 RepID=A0ABR4DPJ1_9PEZI
MGPSTITLTIPEITTYHKHPYPRISPHQPSLSQAGRTVVIVGGSAGIGFAIARAFIHASAATVIITGRRPSALADAVARLKTEVHSNGSTSVRGVVSDLADSEASAKLWDGLRDEGVVVDVLVLNAMAIGEAKPLLEAGVESVWKAFGTNVRGLLDYAERFEKQEGKGKKYLVNVSTSGIHHFNIETAAHPTYSLTKNAGTLALQLAAKDTNPTKLQIVSFHPGGILSEAAKNAGYDESTMDWDHEDLPGQLAVWLSTDEAQFLHGRFLPVWWDVDELTKGPARARIEADEHFLRIGVVGL